MGEIGLTAKSEIAVGTGKRGRGKEFRCGLFGIRACPGRLPGGIDGRRRYGPSIPHLLGTTDRPAIIGNGILPVEVDGIKVMSMGFLVPSWRRLYGGPMLHAVLMQFFRDTQWGDLDYLIIDLPPGTGDVAFRFRNCCRLPGRLSWERPGRGFARRGQGHRDSKSERGSVGDDRKHEFFCLSSVRRTARYFEFRWGEKESPGIARAFSGRGADCNRTKSFGRSRANR